MAASAGTILYAERRSVFSVAIGVSPVPTRYRVKMAGIWTFVRCGADILLSGLHSDIEGEARCPICGASILFRIENRIVVDLRPRTAILHVVELPSSPGVIAIACEETQLFDKESCVREWLSRHAGSKGIVEAPQDYLARCLVRRTPQSA